MSPLVLRTDSGAKALDTGVCQRCVVRASEIAGTIFFAASHLATFSKGGGINLNGGPVLCG